MFKIFIDWIKGIKNNEKIDLTKQVFNIDNNIIYPTKETIINIHELIVKFFETEKEPVKITVGTRYDPNLDHLLYHIKEFLYDKNKSKQENTLDSGLYLINFLFTSHTFNDGNKRTGFVVFVLFLMLNDYPVNLGAIGNYQKHVEFFKKIASRQTNDEKNIPELFEWFNNYMKKN